MHYYYIKTSEDARVNAEMEELNRVMKEASRSDPSARRADIVI